MTRHRNGTFKEQPRSLLAHVEKAGPQRRAARARKANERRISLLTAALLLERMGKPADPRLHV